jgi:ketosteroid isomerase-like protein
MSTKELIQSYYDSLNQKDDKRQELWSEDAVFSDASQTFDARGKEAVIQSFSRLTQVIEGVKVKHMIAESNAACAIVSYDYINSKGGTLKQDVAEVWEVKDEKLAKLTIYLDLTAYMSFMRG